VSGDRAGISKTRDRSAIQPRNRHNETVKITVQKSAELIYLEEQKESFVGFAC